MVGFDKILDIELYCVFELNMVLIVLEVDSIIDILSFLCVCYYVFCVI